MPRPKVGGLTLLLAIGVWLAILVVALVVTIESLVAASLLLHDGDAARRLGADFAAIVSAEAYLALLVALFIAFGGRTGVGQRLGFHFTSWRHLGLAFLVWLAAVAVGGTLTGIQSAIFRNTPENNTSQVLGLAHDPVFVAVIVPTITLLGPFTEELLFRGALFGWLRGHMPVVLAALLSAAAFGGLHFIPTLFVFLFSFGLAAAFVYHLTGSTLNTFVMHACQNTLAVVATYLSLSHGG
jgi:membrane protease YdiL (CAAX protease family)